MRRQLFAVAIMLSSILSAPTRTQDVSDAAIETAIAAGRAKKESQSVVVSPFSSSFTIVIDGPLIRVQRAAADAAKEYRSFTRADVSEDLLASVVNITAVPDKPVYNSIGKSWVVTPAATHLVIQAKSGPALQPTKTETFPMDWGNAFGATFHGQGIIGTFDLADVPQTDFDVVVVTDGRETRVTVKKKDREKIR